MKKRLVFLALVLACMFTMGGCSSKPSESDWNAVCEIYLDNLPEEYNTLPDCIREKTSIMFSLTSGQVEKEYTVKLTEGNGYRQEIEMIPGSYSVGNIYVRNTALGELSVHAKANEVSVEQNQKSQLAVSLDHAESLTEMIRLSQPSDEIKNMATFSRKVQYAGSILDFNQLRETISLPDVSAEILMSGETLEVSCPGYDGLVAILKNTGAEVISAEEASVVGMRFSKINAVFPGGIAVGDTLKSVVHADAGRLGTPSYCTGSPLIGMEGCTVVYLDATSGDRLSLEIDGSGSYVTSITYEFEIYQ